MISLRSNGTLRIYNRQGIYVVASDGDTKQVRDVLNAAIRGKHRYSIGRIVAHKTRRGVFLEVAEHGLFLSQTEVTRTIEQIDRLLGEDERVQNVPHR